MKLTCSAFVIVHKNAEFLRKAVESMTAQTRRPEQFSSVVTDDLEETARTAREFLSLKGGGVDSVFCTAAPLTCAGSKNRAASLTTTDAFFTLDADDYLDPRFIECCLGRMELSSADVVGCDYRLQFPDGHFEAAALPGIQGVYQANPLPSCSIIRTSAYRRVWGGFRDMLYDDWAMWITLSRMSCKLERVPESLFTYVRHAGALTQPHKHGLAMRQLREMHLL